MKDDRTLRRLGAPALLTLLGLLGGCSWVGHRGATTADASAAHPLPTLVAEARPVTRTRRVVLVTIDGARWQEIFHGVDPALAQAAGMPREEQVAADALLPNLYRRVAARGVALGAPGHGLVEASGPVYVSQPGYQEIFAGRPTGCRSNHCGPTTVKTLPEELAEAAPEGTVVSIASWEQMEWAVARAPGRITVSAGRLGGETRRKAAVSHAAARALEEAEHVSAWPGLADYRPDAHTAKLALEVLRASRPHFLHVGLGDPDEHAHRDDYRGYLASLRAADATLGALLDVLADQPDGEETTVLVTADHGRNEDFKSHGESPASARVFLFAAGGAVPSRGFAHTRETLHLADLAPTVRALLGLDGSRAISAMLPLPGAPLGGWVAEAR